MQYWRKNRCQNNGTESHETDPCMYGNLRKVKDITYNNGHSQKNGELAKHLKNTYQK